MTKNDPDLSAATLQGSFAEAATDDPALALLRLLQRMEMQMPPGFSTTILKKLIDTSPNQEDIAAITSALKNRDFSRALLLASSLKIEEEKAGSRPLSSNSFSFD